MTFRGWLEISFVLIAVVAAAWPFSRFIETVFVGKKTVLTPLENMFYRLACVDPIKEQNWLFYTLSMLVFSSFCFVALYLIQRCQAVLPFNPLSQPAVAPDLAFNTAISFITNANWQAYAGETTMSHFTQMAGLTTHNFLDSAVAIATAVALARAFVRRETEAIGNFWVDITRATLYVLLPLSVVVALVSIALGMPQTLQGAFVASTLEGAKQTISIGPVASQEAIKLLGNNGGGFFNANSAHPFENPSALSNMIENWSQLILPTALVLAFGRMVGDQRQGLTLLAVMTLIFLGSLVLLYHAEAGGNPLFAAIGLDPAAGDLEGKDLRFGHAGAALFAVATTGTGTGAANATFDSMTPVAGMVAMFNLLTGCIAPGGVGTGLYSLLLFAVIAVFIGGLMVGRTPEYLGKKIEAYEIRLAILAILVQPILTLGFAAAAANLPVALASLGNAGPHGLSEILYAYASTSADNGSAFSGLSANTLWFNLTTGCALFFGRYAHAIPVLAMAGALAKKKKAGASAGTFPTYGPMFATLVLGVILIVVLLEFFPALALGPIVEQVLFVEGKVF
jgi:potassium-transporting ATPase potassium-binding subunit